MKRFIPAIIVVLVALGISFGINYQWPSYAKNPDPNHAHADFAVWIGGQQLDFSDPQYMSGSSDVEEENEHPHEHLHEYLHLHDGNGHVIHRHKPELTLGDFFNSLPGISCAHSTFTIAAKAHHVRLFVNGAEAQSDACDVVFQDNDHLLLTDATDDGEVQRELSRMTNDACLYSKTCPWRGEPPIENCVADPMVPCTE